MFTDTSPTLTLVVEFWLKSHPDGISILKFLLLKSFNESTAFVAEITAKMTNNTVKIPKAFELNLKLSPINIMEDEIKKNIV